MKETKDFKHLYIISSERGFSDEIDCEFYTDLEYDVGDIMVLDDIEWYVTEVIR